MEEQREKELEKRREQMKKDPTRDPRIFRYVIAPVGVVRLGFKPNGVPGENFYVSKLEPLGFLELEGLSTGDELVALQKKNVSLYTPDEMELVLTMRPLEMQFLLGDNVSA